MISLGYFPIMLLIIKQINYQEELLGKNGYILTNLLLHLAKVLHKENHQLIGNKIEDLFTKIELLYQHLVEI